MNLMCINKGFSRQFSNLGRLIGNRPVLFILGPIILSAILSSGIIRIQINRDADDIFTSVRGEAIQNKRLAQQMFPLNTSSYTNFVRSTTRDGATIIQITAKDEKTILTEQIFVEIERLNNMVENVTVVWKGELVNYTTLCGKQFGSCFRSSFIELMPHLKDILSGKYKVKYPIDINNLTFTYKEYVLSLGKVSLDDRGFVKDVEAVRLLYLLDISDVSKRAALKKWEALVHETLKGAKFNHIYISVLNEEVAHKEIEQFTKILLPKIPIVFIVVMIFSFISCMTNDWIKSKPWLGPSACISAGLSIISGFGLMFYLGVDYADCNISLCYSVLAIEIDDAFILIAAWRRSNPKLSVSERMGETYSEAAVSITITSLTNLLSYSIGIASPYPGVVLFCMYAASCTVFTYIFQITFFGGCMALSGFREERGLHSLTFRRVKGKEDYFLSNVYKEDFVMAQFREKIGSLLTYTSTKCVVLAIFFANLAFASWGLSFLKFGSEYTDILNDNSAGVRFSNTLYKYFGQYSYPVHVIFNKPLNYENSKTQLLIEQTMKKFESNPHIAESNYRISWLKYYKYFINHPFGRFVLRGYNTSNKEDFINGLREVFLRLPQAKEFSQDIAFNKNYTEIVASRFLILMKNINSINTEIKVMRDMYNTANQSPLPVKVTSLTFHHLEQALLIQYITIETALIASALICVIFFILVPNITCALCISVVIICIIFETVGFMSFFNIKLDMISLTILIICVGFSINYPTHISSSYVLSNNLKSDERLKKVIYEVGFPIFQGSVSTILGVSILAIQPYYICRSFFTIIAIVAFQTGFHAMFVIPVLLSILQYCDKSLSVARKSSASFRCTVEVDKFLPEEQNLKNFDRNEENM